MEPSRYQLVDSLYGPGTVGAWLLTLCTVLISWTLNASSRREDTISVDLIAALLLPLVAASHLVFLVARLPVSVAEAITSQDIEVQKYASALEAPLNVCETFSMAALLLAVLRTLLGQRYEVEAPVPCAYGGLVKPGNGESDVCE